MIPSVPSGHRISRVLPIRRRHEGHKVPPTRASPDPISMVLRTSTGGREAPPDNIRNRASKDSTRPAVDRCIRRTDRRRPAKDDQLHPRQVRPHPVPEPTRTAAEATQVVRIRHRPSNDPTSSNRPRARARVRPRRHRPDHPEGPKVVRDHPVDLVVLPELPVPPDSRASDRDRRGPRVPREGIPERHRSRRNRITTDKISQTNLGGIPTLRRTSNRTRPTSSDQCIPADGRVRASTAASTRPKVPKARSPASGARTTVHPGQPDRPEVPVVFPREDRRGHPTSGTRRVVPVAIRRRPTGIRRGRDRSSSSNRRIRHISRANSNPGTRCRRHPDKAAPRCAIHHPHASAVNPLRRPLLSLFRECPRSSSNSSRNSRECPRRRSNPNCPDHPASSQDRDKRPALRFRQPSRSRHRAEEVFRCRRAA